VPFVIAGAAALVTAGMSWFLLDETVNKDQQPAEARGGRRASLSPIAVAQNSALVLILIVAFVGQFGLGMLQSTFALFGDAVIFQGYSERATDLGVGLLLAVVGVGQFITQARLIGPLKRRFGDARLLIGGILIRSVALVLFAIVFSPWFAALAALIFAVGMGLMMPPLQSLATRTVDDSMRGGVLGVYQSSVSLATIISTAIAGVIFSIDPTFPYWIGALLSFLVVIPALILWQRSRADELKPDELPEAAD